MRKIRIELITSLVWAYRHAENTFDDTGDDSLKSDLDDVISECKLTKTEHHEFNKQCNISGI